MFQFKFGVKRTSYYFNVAHLDYCLSHFPGTNLHILSRFFIEKNDFPTIIKDIDDNLIGEEGKSRLIYREIYHHL